MAGNIWVSSKTPIVTRLAAGVGGTSAGPLYPSKTATIRVRGPGVGDERRAGYVWAIVGPLTYPAPGLPHRRDDRLSLIDMRSDRVASSMRLRRSTTSIAFGYGSAWIGAYDAGGSWSLISAGSVKPEWIRLVRAESCGPPYDPGPLRGAIGRCGSRKRLGSHLRSEQPATAHQSRSRDASHRQADLRFEPGSSELPGRGRRLGLARRGLGRGDRPGDQHARAHDSGGWQNEDTVRNRRHTRRRLGRHRQRLLRHHRPMSCAVRRIIAAATITAGLLVTAASAATPTQSFTAVFNDRPCGTNSAATA